MVQIILTVGGYEALHCVVNAVTNPGDEVIYNDIYLLYIVLYTSKIKLHCWLWKLTLGHTLID